MGKLSDMRVQRVDGVDRPAIKKRWVLVKSEDAPETVEKDYAGAARAVVEALAKEESVSFSDETVEVLRALVELLELDVEFKSEDGQPASDDGEDDGDGENDGENDGDGDGDGDGEDAGDPADDENDVEKTYSADQVEEIVARALTAAGVDPKAVVTKGEGIGKLTPRSRQPKGQDGGQRQVKKGEGLFSNVVFGKASSVQS